MKDTTKLLTAKEFAGILSISEFTVRQLAREGQIPSLFIKGRYRFDVKTLVRFFKKLERSNAA